MSGEGKGPSSSGHQKASGQHDANRKPAKDECQSPKKAGEWINHGLTLVAVAVSAYAVMLSVDANKLTREQMREEMRPWVSIESAIGSVRLISGEGAVIGVAHRFRNHGRYPAVDGKLAIGLLAINEATDEQEGNSVQEVARREVEIACRDTNNPYGVHSQPVIFPGVETRAAGDPERSAAEMEFSANETSKRARLVAIGCLRYQWPGSDVAGVTKFAYDIYFASCDDFPTGEDLAESMSSFRTLLLGSNTQFWSDPVQLCLVPIPEIATAS